MPWDLNLSPEGDLVFGPNNDLLLIHDPKLVGQRIKLRLKVQRPWSLDRSGRLGARLLNFRTSTAPEEIEARVREALLPMSDVNIERIQVSMADPKHPLVTIGYSPRNPVPESTVTAPQSYVIDVPLAVGD